VYESLRNHDLDARGFFGATSPFTSLTISELLLPVWIPKLYHGRNKTFFFFF
jgi:hypothetical protein